MYLNGDYQKILKQDESNDNTMDEINDISCDPDQMMKQGQDVEWLLGGDNELDNTYQRPNTNNK